MEILVDCRCDTDVTMVLSDLWRGVENADAFSKILKSLPLQSSATASANGAFRCRCAGTMLLLTAAVFVVSLAVNTVVDDEFLMSFCRDLDMRIPQKVWGKRSEKRGK